MTKENKVNKCDECVVTYVWNLGACQKCVHNPELNDNFIQKTAKINWQKIPAGTRVWVSDEHDSGWVKRKFAGMMNDKCLCYTPDNEMDDKCLCYTPDNDMTNELIMWDKYKLHESIVVQPEWLKK